MSRFTRAPGRPMTWAVLGALVVIVGAGVYWFQPQTLFLDDNVDEALPAEFAVAATTRFTPTTAAPPDAASPVASTAPSDLTPAEPATAASAGDAGLASSSAPSGLTPAGLVTVASSVAAVPAPAPEPAATVAAPIVEPPATTVPSTVPSGPVEVGRGEFRGLEHSTSGTAIVTVAPDGSRLLRFENLDTSNGPDLRVILSSAALSDDWKVWGDDYVEIDELKGNVGNQNYLLPNEIDLARYGRVVIWCDRFDVGFGVADLTAG